jgi:hypothetical protein
MACAYDLAKLGHRKIAEEGCHSGAKIFKKVAASGDRWAGVICGGSRGSSLDADGGRDACHCLVVTAVPR